MTVGHAEFEENKYDVKFDMKPDMKHEWPLAVARPRDDHAAGRDLHMKHEVKDDPKVKLEFAPADAVTDLTTPLPAGLLPVNQPGRQSASSPDDDMMFVSNPNVARAGRENKDIKPKLEDLAGDADRHAMALSDADAVKRAKLLERLRRRKAMKQEAGL